MNAAPAGRETPAHDVTFTNFTSVSESLGPVRDQIQIKLNI